MIDSFSEIHVPVWWMLACLYPVVALCLLGVLLPERLYRDNLAQTVGLLAIAAWALGRIDRLWDRVEIGRDFVGAYQFLLAAGLLMYMLGTAWDAWRRRGKP